MKNNVYPCKPQFYYVKVGFKGVKIVYMFNPCVRDRGNNTIIITVYGLCIDLESI